MKTEFDKFITNPANGKMFSSQEIPENIYHAEKRFISKHALDVFADCPAKYKAWLDGELPPEESSALRFGGAFHCYVLEPERFLNEYTTLPPEIKVRRGKAYEEFLSQNEGKTVLTNDEISQITAMQTALFNHPKAAALLSPANGKSEQTILFSNAMANGRLCKARIDKVLPDARILVDLKTCGSAHPKAFASAVEKFRYDVQAAFYLDAIAHTEDASAITEKSWLFYIVAIEKEPPYAVAVYSLAKWLTVGAMTLENDFAGLLKAEKTNEWHGYEVADDELPLPKWVESNRKA